MPAETKKRWTADEARELNQEGVGTRYEVVDGELLVTPSPRGRHQLIVFEFAVRLRAYVAPRRIGTVLLGPADIELEHDSTLGPDVFVMPLANGKTIREWREVSSLLLVAEVLSPSSIRHDRIVKRDYFMRNGVPVYWVVDLDARLVEQWRNGQRTPDVIRDTLVWHPNGASESFALDLSTFFHDVLDG
jgi:Uma2 family endonuclease